MPGGADSYFREVDEDEREFREEEFKTNERSQTRRELVISCLVNGYFWNFRRSAGQTALINVSYGMVAASVAEMTEGLIYSGDGAWDYERFPATADEFYGWYFRPEAAIGPDFKEWSERCLRAIAEESAA